MKIYLLVIYFVKTVWIFFILILYMTFNGYVIFAATFGLTLGYAINGDMREEWERTIETDGAEGKETTCCWYEDLDFDE